MDLYSNLKQGEKGAWLSIITYLVLSTVKLTIGITGNSEALRADGLNNTTDIIASIAVLIGLRISQRPPDANHQYGHLRAETIASLVASFIMLLVGLEVLSSAIQNMWQGNTTTPSSLTAYVALISGGIMYLVYRHNLALATRINSAAVKAAAMDNRSDALVSLGAAVGIIAAILGFPIIDSITAVLVAAIIIKTAIEIFWDAVKALTDAFEIKDVAELTALIAEVEGVCSVKNIRGRTHGNMYFIDVTITVATHLNVVESHHITEQIEQHVQTKYVYSHVHVHIEPE